jgi:hypothetical protein
MPSHLHNLTVASFKIKLPWTFSGGVLGLLPEDHDGATQISSFCLVCGARRRMVSATHADFVLRLLEMHEPIDGRCGICGALWSLSPQERLVVAEELAFSRPSETGIPDTRIAETGFHVAYEGLIDLQADHSA